MERLSSTSMDTLFAAIRSRDTEQVRELLRRHPEAARARDAQGATPLHYAAELGEREIVEALLAAGADVNARDTRFGATAAGWAIEYLRERGALLGIEIEDALFAIARGYADLAERYVNRLPQLRDAVDRDGVPLREHARRSGNEQIARLFGISE
jgi:hypothetical protein